MNLKAYMRGIGAGMIVAALIMGVPTLSTAEPSEPIDKTTLINPIPAASVSKGEKTEEGETASSVSGKETSAASVSGEVVTSTEKLATSTGASASKETSDSNGSKTSTGTSASTSTSVSASTSTSVSTSASTGTSTSTGTSASTSTSVSASTSTSVSTSASTGTSASTSTSTSASTSASVSTSTSAGTSTGDTETDRGQLLEETEFYKRYENVVVFTVMRGDSSVRVARHLFEAGMVESAVEFDKYLCQNGYDHSISVGTYEIAYGLDFETMAKIITRRR